MARRVAVVGAGWSGLAAAVRAVEAGHAVTVFEMAARPGGRARSVDGPAGAVDNGQHILIGAYRRTLALMASVGADADALLFRMPLTLRYPDGGGLSMRAGPPLPAFVRAVATARGWSAAERLALLAAAGGWALRGFRCDAAMTVDDLCRRLPPAVRERLIDPLCVAALNTPAAEASARVLLRVLRDALFSGRGSADLLLPRRPLGSLLPEPAMLWLASRGAEVRAGHRVLALERDGRRWRVDGESFDGVVLACTAAESARLAAPVAPGWAAQARGLRYEPIVTVLLRCEGARLPAPMTALLDGPSAPAQFAFDHGALGGPAGVFAFVASGARAWTERGLDATAAAVVGQAAPLLPGATILRVLADKRATFRCTPALHRPPQPVADALVAAGDYVEGPYPATLEGAVRAGERAVALLGR